MIKVKDARRIKEERAKQGYNQKEFARVINITSVRMSQIETLPIVYVTERTAHKITTALNIDWGDLFAFE